MITRLFWWELKAGSFIGFTGKYQRQLGVLSSYWILLSYYQNCSDTMLFFAMRQLLFFIFSVVYIQDRRLTLLYSLFPTVLLVHNGNFIYNFTIQDRRLTQSAQEELRLLQAATNEVRDQMNGEVNQLVWKWSATGQFSVKMAYLALKEGPTVKSNLNRIWKIKIPPRMRVFAWLMRMNRLLTIDNLMKSGWNMANWCVMCKRDRESVSHLSEECRAIV